jgi:hypothetical protein
MSLGILRCRRKAYFDFEIGLSENNSFSLIINGRLAVKSVVGQGTEFTMDLPLWKERDIRNAHE